MIEPRRMALQAAGDLPQARRTGKLAIKQRDELAPGRKTANMLVGPVPGNQPVENSPGNLLQKIVETLL